MIIIISWDEEVKLSLPANIKQSCKIWGNVYSVFPASCVNH